MKYIVVIGNLAHVIGPFNSRREADMYASTIEDNPRWFGYSVTVTVIYPPSITPA